MVVSGLLERTTCRLGDADVVFGEEDVDEEEDEEEDEEQVGGREAAGEGGPLGKGEMKRSESEKGGGDERGRFEYVNPSIYNLLFIDGRRRNVYSSVSHRCGMLGVISAGALIGGTSGPRVHGYGANIERNWGVIQYNQLNRC